MHPFLKFGSKISVEFDLLFKKTFKKTANPERLLEQMDDNITSMIKIFSNTSLYLYPFQRKG